MTKDVDVNAPIQSAEALRLAILEKELAKADKQSKLLEEEHRKHDEFAKKFLSEHVTDEEKAVVRRLVAHAVKDGKFEAMVYSFPSDLCTDSGRAITNGEEDWPETLQGKAKEFYERFEAVAKPQGYRLKAMVISFPGGMPGDVGLFLNWAPKES